MTGIAPAPRKWLVTGAAGFIGSNLVERLLQMGRPAVGLDNFSTGSRRNLEGVLAAVGPKAGRQLEFLEGDIRDLEACRRACRDVEVVIHQAALGSVPRSIRDPLTTHQVNVDGLVNMLIAARDAGVKRFIYASSSSVYGDHPGLPKVEERLGKPLSPYAASKRTGEIYAMVFSDVYGLETIGLRYFNVFGRRQDPEGPYAAVIPKWLGSLLRNEQCVIFGDGSTSRDFCYIDNVIEANLLAAAAPPRSEAVNKIYNVAVGGRTTLTALFSLIRERLAKHDLGLAAVEAAHQPFREGDVRHSEADISRARQLLGYTPRYSIAEGLDETVAWYFKERALSS